MKHKKIIKKIHKIPRRFQSHEYKRVKVSCVDASLRRWCFRKCDRNVLFCSLTITERSVVLIASLEEEWRVLRKCQRSVASRTTRHVTCFQTVSRSSSSATRKILKFSSWTIGPTAVKLTKPLDPKRGKSRVYLLYVEHALIFIYCFRLRIVQRAKELSVRLTNGTAKSKKESAEWASEQERTVVLFTFLVRIYIQIIIYNWFSVLRLHHLF